SISLCCQPFVGGQGTPHCASCFRFHPPATERPDKISCSISLTFFSIQLDQRPEIKAWYLINSFRQAARNFFCCCSCCFLSRKNSFSRFARGSLRLSLQPLLPHSLAPTQQRRGRLGFWRRLRLCFRRLRLYLLRSAQVAAVLYRPHFLDVYHCLGNAFG